MAEISVSTVDPTAEDHWTFQVVVDDTRSTEHTVTMRRVDYERLTGETVKVGETDGPERFIRESFQFLLDREPQGSILGQFDVTIIPRYFPEYEGVMMGKYGQDG